MAFKEIVRECLTEAELDELAESVIPGFKRTIREPEQGNTLVGVAVDEIMKFI